MKNFFLLIASAFCLLTGNSYGQSFTPSALNTALLAPTPLKDMPKKGSMILFPTDDGLQANAFYIPSDKPSDMALFIFHEWWGLNDNVKREAALWHKLLGGRVAVYALDIYDGNTAKDPETAEKLMRHIDYSRGCTIVRGALTHIGQGKHVAMLGWGLGGSWAFTAAIQAETAATACVMYYGFPEPDIMRVRNLYCDVLYIRADRDELIKLSEVQEFEKKVQASDKNVTMIRFPAAHAFANPGSEHYDAELAEVARNHSLKFIKDRYGIN